MGLSNPIMTAKVLLKKKDKGRPQLSMEQVQQMHPQNPHPKARICVKLIKYFYATPKHKICHTRSILFVVICICKKFVHVHVQGTLMRCQSERHIITKKSYDPMCQPCQVHTNGNNHSCVAIRKKIGQTRQLAVLIITLRLLRGRFFKFKQLQ